MDNQDDLKYLLNKYKIDKNKYLNCISNIDFYNRENVIEKDINISDLICPICYYILKQPRFCSSNNNSHPFCKECIDKYLVAKNNCPLCKNNFENKTKNEFEDELHKLDFKCLFFKEGCTKVVNYLEYFNHIHTCKYNNNLLYECKVDKYNYIKKEFEKCSYIGNKEEMKVHFKGCELIKYKCIFCNESILKIDLKEHIENKCKLGIYKYINNEKYIGENKNKIRDGYGKYYYSNGNKYEGEWKNSKREGYGIYYYYNGDKYEGGWKNDIKEGYGILYLSDGAKYEGEFKNDKYNGYGIYYFSSGSIYEREWKNDIKTEYINSNGYKYEGEFKNNKRNGYGILYLSDGAKYEGEFKNNNYDGYGIYYYYHIKTKYEGKWKNGFPYLFSKGLKYERNWSIIQKFSWFFKGILLILYFFAYLYKIINKTIILILILILINYYY